MNMISRKTEERNEKIVRGLLKLPPNRRCINCDSLGPQYVCTNFWTFICTTCSGIHREFTHRVKSISMSKFTTEEVEALQNGGNQRARELYLKGWDFQIQRLPTSSNVEKIREFIKNTYLDKKYVAAKVSDTPTDYQSSKSRASSYHSYSQSPPYDHQYEERKYGKRAPVLTRKSGSERNLHIENLSSFSYSTTGMSEKANAKRYANEDSISRHSLHSETSVGDPFRSDVTSPSSCSIHGFSSPFSQDSIEWNSSTVMEEDARRDGNKVPRPQRALSAGSFGSYGRDSVSSYSFHSDSQVTNAPEHNRTVGRHQSDILSVPSAINSGTLDLFANQVVLQPVASSTVDFFQLPTTSTSTSTFIIPHTSTFDSHLLPNLSQSPITPSPYVNQFGNNSPDLPFLTNIDPASSEVAIAKSEGWATFDKVPVDSSLRVPLGNAPHKYDTVPTFSEKTNESLQFENKVQAYNVDAGSYPTVPSPWSDVMQQQTFTSPTFSQTQWSAFDDPMGHTQWGNIPLKVDPYYAMSTLSAESNQYMSFITEGLNGNVTISENVPPFSHSFYQQTSSDLNSDLQPYSVKYTNPFDLPFDLDSDSGKELLNMNSLRASLPSESVFPDEFADPWKSHYPVTTLPIQANIPFKAAESQPSHFMDVSPHGPITSIGGNLFA